MNTEIISKDDKIKLLNDFAFFWNSTFAENDNIFGPQIERFVNEDK